MVCPSPQGRGFVLAYSVLFSVLLSLRPTHAQVHVDNGAHVVTWCPVCWLCNVSHCSRELSDGVGWAEVYEDGWRKADGRTRDIPTETLPVTAGMESMLCTQEGGGGVALSSLRHTVLMEQLRKDHSSTGEHRPWGISLALSVPQIRCWAWQRFHFCLFHLIEL